MERNHRRMMISLTLICLFLTEVKIAQAKKYTYPTDNFSITISDKWIEIPKDIIDQYAKATQELSKNKQSVHMDYGFQLKNSKEWFDYPYIGIQINRNGPMAESELKKIPKLHETAKNVRNNFPTLISEAKLNKMLYDPENQIIVLESTTKMPAVGTINGIASMYLTKYGAIKVFCYVEESEFNLFKNDFDNILSSVTIPQEIKYTPKNYWEGYLAKGIAYAFVGMIFMIFTVIYNKVIKKKKPEIT